MQSLTEFMDHSLRDYVASAAVPIVEFSEAGEIDVANATDVATGTFFGIDDRLFLVTARHAAKDMDLALCAFPHRMREADFCALGNIAIVSPTDDQDFIDVAVIEILDAHVKQAARNGWRILSVDDARECPPEGRFLLFGCPAKTISRDGDRLVASPVSLEVERLRDVPDAAKSPVYENIDLFFSLPTTAVAGDSSQTAVPHLMGLSGCSIWVVDVQSNISFWTQQSVLKVVGVQSASVEGEYIRAKSWKWVQLLIERFDTTDKTIHRAQ